MNNDLSFFIFFVRIVIIAIIIRLAIIIGVDKWVYHYKCIRKVIDSYDFFIFSHLRLIFFVLYQLHLNYTLTLVLVVVVVVI